VLFGLCLTGRPFGVRDGRIGVIALPVSSVNNNIVLIDTYNDSKKTGPVPRLRGQRWRTAPQRFCGPWWLDICETNALGAVTHVIA